MSSSGDYEDWVEQLYRQPPDTPPAYSAEFADDSTAPTTTTTSKGSPKSPLSKPIRRRSRTSKKTPTTILNANANNFRSLVQQFTGRPKSSAAAFPLGPHRGPVNLNFSNYRQQDYNYGATLASGSSSSTLTYFPDQTPTTTVQMTVPPPTENSSYNYNPSSFSSYSTGSNFDGSDFVLAGSSGESSVAVAVAPHDEEFDQFDLARVSESLSYTPSTDYFW